MTQHERRKFSRVPVSIEARYRLVGRVTSAAHAPARGTNIGEGGVCLVLGERFPIGSLLQLKLLMPDTNETITVAATVAHTAEVSVGTARTYDIGMEFVGIREEQRDRISRFINAPLSSGRSA